MYCRVVTVTALSHNSFTAPSTVTELYTFLLNSWPLERLWSVVPASWVLLSLVRNSMLTLNMDIKALILPKQLPWRTLGQHWTWKEGYQTPVVSRYHHANQRKSGILFAPLFLRTVSYLLCPSTSLRRKPFLLLSRMRTSLYHSLGLCMVQHRISLIYNGKEQKM